MEFSLCSNYLKWDISNDGITKSFMRRSDNTEFGEPNCPFCYLKTANEMVLPHNVEKRDNILIVSFEKPKVCFHLLVEEEPTHITFTIIKVIPDDVNYEKFFFGCCSLIDKEGTAEFSGCTIPLDIKCLPNELPGYCTELGASVTHSIGEIDVSAAIIGAPRDKMPSIIRQISKNLTIDKVIVSSKGGSFAVNVPETYTNYAEACSTDGIDNIESYIAPYVALGVKQFNFQQRLFFRQGDCTFLLNGLSEFKKNVVDVLHSKGLKAGIHTYSTMISTESCMVTPIPDKDLAIVDKYILAYDISEDTVEFSLDDAKNIKMAQLATYNIPNCLQIGNEIIGFSATDKNGKIKGCKRGMFGTKPTAHKAKDDVKYLMFTYEYLNAEPGSQLFYNIAKRTADLYNDGDFDAIYLDGLEVISYILSNCSKQNLSEKQYCNGWYYEALFVQEILKNVNKVPILEYSTLTPAIWAGRSRAGTFDIFDTAFQDAIDIHCKYNENYVHRRLLPSQLGWYELNPIESNDDIPFYANWFSSYQFEEDIDYLGQKMIAFRSGVSYIVSKKSVAYLQREKNMKTIQPYYKLRDNNYFNSKLRDRLKYPDTHYKLIIDGEKFGFQRKERLYGQAFSLKEKENSFVVNNNFSQQNPSIRMIAQHTAVEDETSFVLAHFDRNIPLSSQNCFCLLTDKNKTVDMSGHEALGVWVKGNSSNEFMNIMILASPAFTSRWDHVISLNFEGWRYFTLCELDNNERSKMKFNFQKEVDKIAFVAWEGYYSRFSMRPTASEVYSVAIGFTGQGNNVYVGDITALKPKKTFIHNPGIIIENKKIIFECDLNSTEYIEYNGGNSALLYNIHGESTDISIRGEWPELKHGDNTVRLCGTSSGNRLIKTYLFVTGEKIFNDTV